MIKVPFAITLATLLVACAGAPVQQADRFNQLAAQTENEIREAEKTGFLWRDTESLLAEARKAMSEGRHEEAMKLAEQSLRQAQLAQQQARANASAGPSYPSSP
jgi:hypothetical protein